jgi:putative transposase
MEAILRDFKSYTSGKIKKLIKDHPQESRREWMLWLKERAGTKNSNNKDFQFWQQHNKPIELYDNQITQQKLDYIHANPVEAGFVSRPEDYVYSSARNYCGEQGALDVLILE